MNKIYLFGKAFLAGIFLTSLQFFINPFSLHAQDYFEDTWYGYKSGEYTDGRFPYSSDIADLNNDGHEDVVISQYALDHGFKILYGIGDGSFQLPVHHGAMMGSQCIRIADFNDDGWSDIVMTNSASFSGFSQSPEVSNDGNSISVYLNLGDGSFEALPEVVTGRHPEELAIVDFDQDGDWDLAVANFGHPADPGNTLSLLENDGNANFSMFQDITVPNFPFRVSVGAINDDELPDLFVNHESNEKTILINNGSGYDQPIAFMGERPQDYNLGTRADVIDMDKDGDGDLVFFNSWGSSAAFVNIYPNDGNGNFSAYEEYMYPLYYGSAVHADYADINNDSWPDIISASYNGDSGKGFFLFESDGSGGFLDAQVYTSGMASRAALCNDADADGDIDVLIVDNSMSVNVHTNLGDGSFPVTNNFEIAGPSSEDTDVADIDKDGFIDLIASSDDGFETNISVMMNNGDGTFAEYYTINREGADQGGAHAKLRDMNGDDWPDIIFTSPVTNINGYLAFIAFNDQSGSFGAPVELAVSSCGWGDIEAVDLDNDGDHDLVISESLACMGIDESGKRLYFLKNNGNGTFQDPYVKNIGPNPESITTADYNDDGHADLATAHWGSYGFWDFIQVHLGDGNGNFAEPTTYGVGRGPHDIITADFNNDGIEDLATGNTGFDGIGVETMAVLLGNGDGSFQPATVYDAPYSSTLMGNSGLVAMDVDHDNDLDILLANQSGSDLSVYINDGEGSFEHLYRVGVNGYGARGPAKADFNNDGMEDLAVLAAPATGFLVGNFLNVLYGKAGFVFTEENTPAEKGMLKQNYPNPFSSQTTITYELQTAATVRLELYDVTGRKLDVLEDQYKAAGSHRLLFNAGILEEGIYLYSIQSGGKAETKSLIIQR